MSAQNQNHSEITPEALRAARHSGFDDSVAHMEQERRERLTSAHRSQDERRERNLTTFYSTVAGND
jgi:cellobiose-specific phosphotransferase system component IIA